ncbi:MAG: caspase family protein [Nostoc sp. DedSLP03]|uniref:caspase family protein n=1 Tax=Nostoc sp. DedSLP03 TaxID=3075400 RepID=UPI002AD50936|nr:caspase family protein [Nostoc sp. DedSLP03]MDZ7966373.1 caspase family protein [Nostoc sp. DedSLP03]
MMVRNIYVLAVGINNYKSSMIPPLRGCVNDVTALDEFLKRHLATNGEKLHIKKLIDEQATRQAIIDGFREHLCQARNNDVALFYFSAHGSQEYAGKEFWHLEPDHLNETLVCWDSRTDGIWDLADKELAKLIAEVSQNHPHFVVILDCCHSGGGTRNQNHVSLVEYTGIRTVNTELQERPFSSFIFSNEERNSLLSASNRFSLPRGEYILLAACRDNELAREHQYQQRGIFSYFLLDSIQRNSNLSYRDLLKRSNILVQSFYANQSPQILTTSTSYLDQPFLGGTITRRQTYFTVMYNGSNGWIIDVGAVHGILSPHGNQKTILAIFPIGLEDISQLTNAIAVAEIIKVFPQSSIINISGEREELNPELIYKAAITYLPLSSLKVYITGDTSGVSFAHQAVQTASFGENASLYICEVDNSQEADFHLKAINDEYQIIHASDNRQLIFPISGFTLESAFRTIYILEHIARWRNIASITSPANSLIPANAVKIEFYPQHVETFETQNYQLSLTYQITDGRLQPPAIQVKLINTSHIKLYCVLLNLTELFAIKVIPFTGGCTGIWLEPGQEIWVLEGEYIPISIPGNFQRRGVREYKDILKLILSTSEFDGNLLVQDKIENLNIRSASSNNVGEGDCLIQQMQKRAIAPYPDEPEQPQILDDWATNEILIVTTIPRHINLQIPDSQICNQSSQSPPTNDISTDSRKFKSSQLMVAISVVFILTLFGIGSWIIIQRGKQDKQKASEYLLYFDEPVSITKNKIY